MNLKGHSIFLRYPIPTDLKALHQWENDPEIWQHGDYSGPFTEDEIRNFILLGQDIFDHFQERLMICDIKSEEPIGCIDLYDFDSFHQRAGVGILIYSDKHRQKGLATEALKLLISYAKDDLKLKQLYCAIEEHNSISLHCFKKLQFEEIGLKKDWRIHNGKWHNEYLLQLILN